MFFAILNQKATVLLYVLLTKTSSAVSAVTAEGGDFVETEGSTSACILANSIGPVLYVFVSAGVYPWAF